MRLNEIDVKKLPHVGWNEVLKKGRLINEVEQNTDFYFVHSYCYKHLEDDIVLELQIMMSILFRSLIVITFMVHSFIPKKVLFQVKKF